MFYFSLINIDTNTESELRNCVDGAPGVNLLLGTDKGNFILECDNPKTCFQVSEALQKAKTSYLRLLSARIATEADGRFHNARN